MFRRNAIARIELYGSSSLLENIGARNPLLIRDVPVIVYIPVSRYEVREASRLTFNNLRKLIEEARKLENSLIRQVGRRGRVSFLIRVELPELLVYVNEDFHRRLSYFYYPKNMEPPVEYVAESDILV